MKDDRKKVPRYYWISKNRYEITIISIEKPIFDKMNLWTEDFLSRSSYISIDDLNTYGSTVCAGMMRPGHIEGIKIVKTLKDSEKLLFSFMVPYAKQIGSNFKLVSGRMYYVCKR